MFLQHIRTSSTFGFFFILYNIKTKSVPNIFSGFFFSLFSVKLMGKKIKLSFFFKQEKLGKSHWWVQDFSLASSRRWPISGQIFSLAV